MSYVVGIDLGTTSTVAAVCRPGGTAQVVPLDGAATAVPSAVYLGADDTFLVGEAAQRRALSDPGHVVRDLTRRIGDATPVLLGRRPVAAEELAARFLAKLVNDVARREGGVAARVAVTYPAGWGPHRMGALHAALAEHGLGSAMLVAEAVAAASGFAAGARVEAGATVGIYDLGGGRCDATVLRRERDGFVVLGESEGVEQFGGADLDEVVLAHVRDALGPAWEALDPADPDVLAAVADLRREAVAAKEALSHDTEVLVPVALPGLRRQVRLGRAEFEEMIRPALTDTVEAVRRALDGAGVDPADLAALVLVGGSSRIPLVPQLLSEEFRRDVTVAPDPVGVVAVGAALVAAGVRGSDAGGDVRSASRPPVGSGTAPSGGLRSAGRSDVGGAAAARAGAAVGGVAAAGAVPGAGSASASPPGPGASPGGAEVPGGLAASGTGRRGGTSGPGTLPLVAGGSSPEGTEVIAVARPPKQARPFLAATETTSRPRRIALFASAGALTLAVLGGVAAFGFERLGAGTEADAVTPAAVDTSAPAPTVLLPTETSAPAPPPPPPSRRATRAPATTRNAQPPVTTEPPPTTQVTDQPTETVPPPDTENPGNGAGAGNGDDDAGAGAGNGDAEEGGNNNGANTGGGDDNAAAGAGVGQEAANAEVAAPAEAPAPAAEQPQEG